MKKVAFVTASTNGIGKSIVKKLLENNYVVYANGRDKNSLNFKGVKFVVGDMTQESNINNALKKIMTKEKRVDLVVANLGSGKSIAGEDVSIDEYRRVFDINFFGAVSLATKAIEFLKKTNGNIVFISSIAGCEELSAPIAYTTAKTALLSFSKSLSNQVAKYNIRVNSISPGNVMFKGSTWDNKVKDNKESVDAYIKNNVPLNKFAKPKDIAKAVLFLEKSEFMTGSNIVVDGGQLKKII
ncbi:MAG: SDR family oxidoreductase [Campylobacterota bacterium]|nr:SDR family oxidoreductase [Campylobacterota bacterium]